MDALERTRWLFVKQINETVEITAGIEVPQYYLIVNVDGMTLFRGFEESGGFNRYFCGANRTFRMVFYDQDREPAFYLERCCYCKCGCLPLNSDCLRVYSSSNILIGSVKQRFSLLYPLLNLVLPDGTRQLHIRGPLGTTCKCYRHVTFLIMDPNKDKVLGQISRQNPSAFCEIFNKAEMFGVCYPDTFNMDERVLVMAATILLHYEYFEK